jgi:hypothetical protein
MDAMHSMIELHPRRDALVGLGLPAIPYPVALPAFKAAVANDGELPLADMLHGLQLRAADPKADWRRMEPAMARLAELLAPDDARESVTAEGGDWWIEVGPLDLTGEVIALQRDDTLLAAITARADGRLRMAAWRSLDGHAIGLLLAMARSGPTPGTPDQRTAWQCARDAATAAEQPTADAKGLTCLSWWNPGPGNGAGGGEVSGWRAQADQPVRRPACVAAEIGTFHMRGDARR